MHSDQQLSVGGDDSLAAAELTSIRQQWLTGCRKHVRVLGCAVAPAYITRSNVVNCSCVDLCSLDLSLPLTSHPRPVPVCFEVSLLLYLTV